MEYGQNTSQQAHPATPNDSDELEQDPLMQIFRPEALAYYTGGRRNQGDLLRIAPTWTRWTYWLLVAVFVCGAIGAAMGMVDQTISGSAVVLLEPTGPRGHPDNNGQIPKIMVLLPGHVRPLLQADMPVQLTLAGYPQARQSLTIDAIEDQIIGPAEVQRLLGKTLAEIVPVTAPVVLLHAHPSSPTFVADGRALAYYQGMQGTVEVRVRSERILFLLAPGLRTWLGM